jgi:hypothetical protein
VLLIMACMLVAGSASNAAEFHVAKTSDTNDIFCTPGPPASPPFDCSLREAIMKANALEGDDIIYLPAGTYLLTQPGRDEDDSETGDLDIRGGLEILGEGADVTIVDGNAIDRVFHVMRAASDPPDQAVEFHDLTIRGGYLHPPAYQGAGVLVLGERLHIEDCIVEDNAGWPGQSYGGGVYVRDNSNTAGFLSLLRTTVRDNSTLGCGGIFTYGSLLAIDESTISGNEVGDQGGGALCCYQSVAAIENSTFANNVSVSESAFVNEDSSTTIHNSTFSNPGANLSAVEPEDEITLSNTIIHGPCVGFYFTTLGGNIEGPGDTCGLENPGDYFAVPILLLPLGDYGGATHTMPPERHPHNLAIDNDWAGPLCHPIDQRGVARPQDGNGDGSAVCDSGAVELLAPGLPFSDGFESGDTSAWSVTVP